MRAPMLSRLKIQVVALAATVTLSACGGAFGLGPALDSGADVVLGVPVESVDASPVSLTSREMVVFTSELEDRLIELYTNANPAVVNVQVASGQGTGFVIDQRGHIVTNYHVAGSSATSRVTFSDGLIVEGRLVGGDPDSDLAVIRVDVPASQLQPLEIGDSDALEVGQIVVAIGNPFGLQGTMTTGIVSGLGRTISSQASIEGGGTFSIPKVVQTDAAINPGNSGGPLLSLSGQVIGVNTAIESASGSNSGVGFAVPSNLVARVVPALITDGFYEHPWLGISGATLQPEIRAAMSLDSLQRGVLVLAVVDGAPADLAGLLGSEVGSSLSERQLAFGGDVIISVDGYPVDDMDDLLVHLAERASVGQTIRLMVLRDGDSMQINVTLTARPDNS